MAVTISASQTFSLFVDLDSDSQIDPGDTLRFSVTIANSGDQSATGVDFSELMSMLTLVGGSTNISPLAFDDSYAALGNVTLSVNAANGLTANDVEFLGDSYTIDTGTFSTTEGGSITIASDGSFSYTSALGFSNADDSFTYTIRDDGIDGIANTADDLTDTATLTLDVGPAVWFIDNSSAGTGEGTQANPYTSIANFNAANNGVDDHPAAGDYIYLRQGTGSYNENDGVNLLNNQTLLGGGVNLVVNHPTVGNVLVENATGAPTIATSGGNGVDLAQNNTLGGFSIGNTGTGIGIADNGGTVGTLTVSNVAVSGSGQIISVDNGGTLAVALTGAASTSSTNGAIDLANVGGSFSVSGATSISGTHSGGGILIQTSSLAANFQGATTVNTGSFGAINYVDNTGSLSFTGGSLDIDTATATAFNASGGGTVNITGTGNSIAANSGGAVVITNTTIGASGITLQSVAQGSGLVNAINLQNTGSSGGGFTVTGTGSTAGSGGTIGAKSGVDGETTTGVGIYLFNTSNISLSNMNFTGVHQNFAIRGDGVNNFTLRDSNFTGTFGNSNAADEGVIRFGSQSSSGNGLTGTALFEGNNIDNGYEDNLGIYNKAAGALNLTVRDSANHSAIFGTTHTTAGNDDIIVETGSSHTLTANISGVTFEGARGDMVQIVAAGLTTQNVTIQNNDFTNAHPDIVSGGGGITVGGAGNNADYNVTYKILNNTFTGAEGNAITASYGGANGTVSGVISGNTIGTNNGVHDASQANGGSTAGGDGIFVNLEQDSSAGTINYAVLIQNNHIYDIASGLGGISLRSNNLGANGTARLEATVTGNTVDELGNSAYTAFYSIVGGSSANDTGMMGLDIRNNTFDAGNAANGNNGVTFDQISTAARYYFPGYSGSANGEYASPPGTASTGLNSYLAGRSNTIANGGFPLIPGSGVDASFVFGAGGSNLSLAVPTASPFKPLGTDWESAVLAYQAAAQISARSAPAFSPGDNPVLLGT